MTKSSNMTRLRMNTLPKVYSKEWSQPKEDSELYIPSPHEDSPALPINGKKQPDGVIRKLSTNARALLSRYEWEADAAITTRESLEKYLEWGFQGVDNQYIPTTYIKVITAFIHMPLKMRFGLECLHLQLCRLVVARCCCENRFPMAQSLAAAARSVHCPDYFEYVDEMTEPCPEFDRLETELVLPDGRQDMSDVAETRRLQVKLVYFYQAMGIDMPFGLYQELFNTLRAVGTTRDTSTLEAEYMDAIRKGEHSPRPSPDFMLQVFEDFLASNREAVPVYQPSQSQKRSLNGDVTEVDRPSKKSKNIKEWVNEGHPTDHC